MPTLRVGMFVVEDPSCPDELLVQVALHFENLLGAE